MVIDNPRVRVFCDCGYPSVEQAHDLVAKAAELKHRYFPAA
jgi:hypothetical protein